MEREDNVFVELRKRMVDVGDEEKRIYDGVV